MSRRAAAAWWTAGLLALGAAAAATRVRSYDFFWHLATGRWIWEHGRVPDADPFSFTAPGVAWVDHAWLYQAALFGLWKAGGLAGPWLGKLLLGAALAWCIGSSLRRAGLDPATALLLALAILAGAAGRLGDRPEAVTLLFVAIAARWLCGGSARAPLLLIPLAALWVNVHAGAILAPAMAAAALAGEAALGLVRRRLDREQLARLGLAAAGSALALLANPYGAAAIRAPFQVARIVAQPWAPNLEWTRPTPALTPDVFLGVLALAVALVVGRAEARGAPLGLGLLGAALGLRYVRNAGVFFVLLPFALQPAFSGRRPLPAWAGPALAAAGLLGFLLAPPAGGFGFGLEPGRYPVEACDYLERNGISGRLFHEVAFGGYLIWRFPGRAVFIDGRNEIYPHLLREIFAGLDDPPRLRALCDRLGIEAALLRYPPAPQRVRLPGPPPRIVERSWSEVFFPARDWALVHWDDTAMVRVRRSAFDPGWIAAREWTLNPDDWPFLRERLRAGEIDPAPLLAEVERRLEAGPCARAQALREELRALAGPTDP